MPWVVIDKNNDKVLYEAKSEQDARDWARRNPGGIVEHVGIKRPYQKEGKHSYIIIGGTLAAAGIVAVLLWRRTRATPPGGPPPNEIQYKCPPATLILESAECDATINKYQWGC